jgi:hypothetical protein
MRRQKISAPLKENDALFEYESQTAMPMIDKILARCEADRKAIDVLDKDQKNI